MKIESEQKRKEDIIQEKWQHIAYLLFRPLNDPLFYSASRDQAVHVNGLSLSNPMNSRHSLKIRLRVPVRIKETARRTARSERTH